MRATSRRLRFAVILVTATALAGAPAWSLTDEEIFRDFQFNFIAPGARAVSLGGAYIAAASDATAAEANPAGLHYVSRKEAFIEFRATRPDSSREVPTIPLGDNSPGSTEQFVDFTLVNNPDDQELASFISYAHPFSVGKRRITVAVTRQVLLSAEQSLTDGSQNTSLDVSLDGFPVTVNEGQIERYQIENTVTGSLDAELVNYNAAVSISVARSLSIGLTATLSDLDVDSNVLGVADDPLGLVNTVNPRENLGGGLGPVQQSNVINDSDTAFGWSFGINWHPDGMFPKRDFVSPFRIGAVYRKGAELEVEETTAEIDNITGARQVTERFNNTFNVPDRYGIGFSYDIGDHWMVTTDVERIEYSDQLEDFRAGVNFFTSGAIPDTLLPIDTDSLDFDVDDATIFRVGGEYSFIGSKGWSYAFRLGYFNDPDNRIALQDVTVNADTPEASAELEAILLDLFRDGDDDDHITGGISVNTPFGLQLQLAADIADDSEEFVFSSIYRFGRIGR